MAKLQALPQNTIVFSQRKKGNVYIYADAAGCNCAFIGTAAAYQQYQQIRAANNIAQMQETTAILNQEAAMDWGGVWGPMRLDGIDHHRSDADRTFIAALSGMMLFGLSTAFLFAVLRNHWPTRVRPMHKFNASQ